MFKKLLCGLGIAGLAVFAAPASADFIDFESDASGSQANGFSSVDSGLVTFSDSSGAELVLDDYGTQGDGQSLFIGSDDASYLIMDFSVLVNNLSLDFGNDDPFYSNAGDTAELRLFLGATQVGFSSVIMNRDDIMNQSIGFSGVDFDRAEFFYNVTTSGLIEIVDNINFDASTGQPPVPEPATMTLLGLGLAGLAARSRKNKTQV